MAAHRRANSTILLKSDVWANTKFGRSCDEDDHNGDEGYHILVHQNVAGSAPMCVVGKREQSLSADREKKKASLEHRSCHRGGSTD